MERPPIESREYKLLLRIDRFAGDEAAVRKSAARFWRDFCARVDHIVLRCDGDLDDAKAARLIVFRDTPERRLLHSSYLLRERQQLDDGRREVTLKCRHPDRYVAGHRRIDVEHTRQARTKFEEDIKTPFIRSTASR
jgi:hypothetical protein